MKRFFCVMLFVACLLTFGACSGDGSAESASFLDKFYNEYLVKFFNDYVTGCAAIGDNCTSVPVIGPVLEFFVSVVAYAIGGIVFVFKTLIAFVLFFIGETAFFVEEIVKGISGTILDLIS